VAERTIRASEAAYHFAGLQRICAYCGDLADTVDHTVPAWFTAGNLSLIARSKLFKVACCRDCNMRAGRLIDRTFIERKRRIAKSLRRANIGILRVAHWPSNEIKPLGYRLKTYVKSGVTRRERVIARLQSLDSLLIPLDMTNELMFNLRT
jgi:hypothetical protein